MKYVLLIVVIVLVLWLLRPRRRMPEPHARHRRAQAAEEMVVCAHCGVHLPRSDALPGRGGLFCGEAHRLAYETEHPQ